MNKFYSFITACTVFGLLTSCSMAPKYQRPELVVPDSLTSEHVKQPDTNAKILQPERIADISWKEVFTDAHLQQLIQTALQENRNLRATALNVQSYQAQYRISRAAIFPHISGDGAATIRRDFDNSDALDSESYSLSVGTTSWEIDFWGRIQSLKDQALETYLAMDASLKSSQTSLIAQVATAYLTLLADRELLQISEETRRIEEDSYALIEQRVEAGIADQMDLAQARTSLEAVKVNLPRYRRQVAQDIHFLNLLAGKPVAAELLAENKSLADVQPVPVLPANLSSKILLQRPDIVAAEHSLMAANASIGAARAAFFPQIRLTAQAGVISGELSDLFDNSGYYSFAPTVSLPIFTAGKLSAELDVAKLQKETSIAQYEYAIQNGFRELSDSLIAFETYDEQLKSQKANLDANQEYYEHAKNRYNEGLDSFLTLLIAQESLYAAKQNYLTMQLSNQINKVNLFKVLGGGWDTSSVQE